MIEKLHDLSPRQFAESLGTVISHSKPIDSLRHLKGRETQLDTVRRAIYAAGRHVFVYGERGVGKTSLAKTAAKDIASSSECFKQVGCTKDSTFESVLRSIIEVFRADRLAVIEKTSGFSLRQILGVERKSTTRFEAPIIDAARAAEILTELDADGSTDLRVVVIDEVDQLQNDDIKKSFADLVKLLGDQGARITFIFTGVGKDMRNILGHHPSAYRQFAQVELDRLDYQSDLDIIDDALEKFGLGWQSEPMRTARFRIASIANGFPYYVHLLTEKLLYALYDDKEATGVGLKHLSSAFNAAVVDALEEIRKPYDAATRGRNEKYKFAVWASADAWALERGSSEIYDSYCAIAKSFPEESVDKKQFLQILAALKREKYGPILSTGFRKGQYKFTENFVRGYVRLSAAAAGVELNDWRPDSDTTSTRVHTKDKRYLDPRKYGGAPAGYRR